ncbi:hypothetical protein M409DRAFT_54310 [Zasmidium cellare ATCC 36951]|uniref:Heme haloperoxidase family profile domain-containing protein n=1 Tax=Zasmidium cellare ATCC 36951 TaxID=1080233 RepID=A0A6A6CIX9_ZASCE|nr:uncharacterized protein M409DRAFT_54310 [Zasmidium cellare ATCC 36951]KAF2167105.1 hypothetical protein M409DRAFT_54310 [Zasmidium cellare ATCC 36951]
MFSKALIAASLASQVTAWPFVAESVGMDPELMKRNDRLVERVPGDAASCPFNPNHVPAVPISTKYPYCGAKNGVPGKQVCQNNLVPANGDTAHYFVAPGKNDIRGPCPGINTAANHNFLAHDGITTFNELIDMQQNVYGVGYDLAVLLAVLGVGLDGDPITGKLSIGCDATTRTASPGLGPELGLDGHNKFEGDTSLTRNDYFTGCDFGNIARYRKQRYDWSVAHNGNFYFGPQSVLLYGAASFLYELFPSLGDQGKPDLVTMDYFFRQEKLPPNWFSRVQPYTIPLVAAEIFKQYEAYPVAFGGNTGNPNTFYGIGQFGPSISNNTLQTTPQGVACLLYQIATENTPSSLGGGGGLPTSTLQWAASKLNSIFGSGGSLASLACPLNHNNA